MQGARSKRIRNCVAAGAFALAGGAALAQEPIRIGVALPLGGQNGEYVKRYFVAPTELATKEINAAGGLLGRQVKLTVEDARLDGAGAVSALTKLINVDKITAVFTAFTPLTLPQLPVAEENKVIVLAASMEHPDLTKSKWAVRMTPTADKAGVVIAGAADKLGLKTAAILSEENEAIRISVRSFASAFEKLGGKIVGDETFKTQDTEMRGQLTKIRAARPDAVYVIVSAGRLMALALKQINESGLKPKQIFANHLVEDREVKSLGGGVSDGVIYTTLDIDPAFIARFKAAFGYEPDANAGKHYDSTMLLFEAIKRAGTDDSTKVRDEIYKFGEYRGVVANFKFDGSGEPTVFPILKVVKGDSFVNYKP